MKLKNLRISRQISLGLSIVLLLFVLFGVFTLYDTNNLWSNTKELYEHPLTVQRALGVIESDVLNIWLKMKELILENDEQKTQEIIIEIDKYESDVFRQMDILIDRYLGPPSDIDKVYNSIVKWRSIRGESIRLLQSGRLDEAIKRIKSDGVGGVQAKNIIIELTKIKDFSLSIGDQFYGNSEQQKNNNVLQLVIILLITLLLTLIINTLLRKGILIPLIELTSATREFQQGKLETRSRYASNNEFGVLSSGFNAMVETVQGEILCKENVAKLSEVMILQDDLLLFCQELLKALIKYTQSQVGTIYLLNGQKTEYEHFVSYGLGANVKSTFSVSVHEGEFGLALATGQIQQLTDIPSDTGLMFSTVIGDFKPKEIWTIPLLNGSEIVAVISLASIRNYSTTAIRLINDIWGELTARFNGVLTFKHTKELSIMLQQTNIELEAQTKELVVQAEELSEQNIELEMQKNLLDEASKLKSSFLSNMSHELRTPLNSVIALASVLNRRLRGMIPGEEYSYLEVIERNGKNLLSLVNDILDLSRIESGKEEINVSCFSIRELVSDLLEMVEAQAVEKGIALLNNVSVDLPSINSDMSMCKHIFQNIISNAVKFTKRGKVEVSAVLMDAEFLISINDNGIGIAADKLSYIFDEFRQADESTSRKYGGTGLGLAIAKKYAELLQGSIAVRSVLGEGTTFTVKLPQMLQSSETAEQTQAMRFVQTTKFNEKNALQNNRSKCILLVEDSQPAIIQMQDIITEQGYEVRIARDGKEALESIKKVLPDAVILDLMMPEVDGFQVLKAIRSVERTVVLPVLILTAKHITKDELNFLKGNHIFQLIQKGSVGKLELLAAVRNMLYKKSEYKKIDTKPAMVPTHSRSVILVVEDNIDNILTVKALLKDSYDIIEANDGITGIEQAKKQMPALILLDISLPVMDGFQVFRELRKDATLQHIPVIALTARAMIGDRAEILNYGFDGYVSKPIDNKLLEETIRGLLDAK